MKPDKSSDLSGKSTKVSILSEKRPLLSKRFKCTMRIGGSRERESSLEAFRFVLHFVQSLYIISCDVQQQNLNEPGVIVFQNFRITIGLETTLQGHFACAPMGDRQLKQRENIISGGSLKEHYQIR
jgi:hypothetical protein